MVQMKSVAVFLVIFQANLLAASTAEIIWTEYQGEVDKIHRQRATGNLDEKTLLVFHQQWYQRLKGATSDPFDPYRPTILQELVGISNAMGNYTDAREWVVLLAKLDTSPAWQIRWKSELGELARAQFNRSGAVSDAKAALEFFNEADEIISKKNSEKPIDFSLVEQSVINLSYAAEICLRLGRHKDALAVVERGLNQILVIPDKLKVRIRTGFDQELFASYQLKIAAHIGDDKLAEKALKTLSSVPTPRLEPSFYAFDYASQLWGGNSTKDNQALLKFMRSWLDAKPNDKWAPFFQLNYADLLQQTGNYSAAITNLDYLYDNHLSVFQAEDLVNGVSSKSGNYARLLFAAARSANEVGNNQKAEFYIKQFQLVATNDYRLPNLKKLVEKSNSLPLKQRSNLWVVSALVLTNLILIVSWRRDLLLRLSGLVGRR
jgi:tetratricopeptide (TPR) repeat protein